MIKFNSSTLLPDEFSAEVYKSLNADLQHLTLEQAVVHYIQHGKYENRKYSNAINYLPSDFDPAVYKSLYADLQAMSDTQAEMHYLYYGRIENRQYKVVRQSVNGVNVQQHLMSTEDTFNLYCRYLARFLKEEFPKIDKASAKKSVIVETRNLVHNEFVIKNTIQKLGDGWGHIVFCGVNNHKQMKSICESISCDIEVVTLEKEVQSGNDYNNLLLNVNFWNKITAEKVLFYQTDTFVFKEFENEFLEFDYIGAPWNGEHLEYLKTKAISSQTIEVGNGGLSIRSVAKTKQILNKYPPIKNSVDYESEMLPEDVYFSKYFSEENFKVADSTTASRFSFETSIAADTFGCHKPWRFFASANELEQFLLHNFLRKQNKRRVLFINHQESLTGAPKVLKEIIRNQKKSNELECFVLSKAVDDDRWDDNNTFRLNEVEGKSDQEKMIYLSNLLDLDMVFANTTETMYLARHFACKKIIFIHEFRSLYPYKNDLKILKEFDKVIVVNKGASDLLKNYGVESEIANYYIDTLPVKKNWVSRTGKLIIGIGYVQFRKGVDRFIRLAERLPGEKFVWIGSIAGAQIENGYVKFDGWNFQTSKYKLGDPFVSRNYKIRIPDNVTFVGSKSEKELYEKWLPDAKLLLMLSYDDPFPLVVIEAKTLNKNVVDLKEAGDSYKICDRDDLVLDEFNEQEIVSYIKGLKPQRTTLNLNFINEFRARNSLVDRAIQQNYFAKKPVVIITEKLKIFTAIHSDSSDDAYCLLEKTVRSLSGFSNVEMKILVNENNKRLSQIAAGGDAEIIQVKHRLNDALLEKYNSWKAVTATYYRTEIPSICKSRNFSDKYVLYCDFDILSLRNPCTYLDSKPFFFQAAPNFKKNDFDIINAGVLYLNVDNMLSVDSEFLEFMKKNLGSLEVHDQTAYNLFFKNKIDKLKLELNWKPYWGINYQAAIIHYHWLKPQTDLSSRSLTEAIKKGFNPGDINLNAASFYQQIWKAYRNTN